MYFFKYTDNKIIQKYTNELNEIQLDKNIKTAYPTKNIRSIDNIDIHEIEKYVIENIKWEKTFEASGWVTSI